MKGLTIGELAKAAGVPTSTVRYYEREGLLSTRRRTRANYRLYTEDDVQRLRFIKAAQATGFTLGDVAELLRPAACGRVQELIEHRLEQVADRIRELRHLQRVLKASLVSCQEHARTGRCKVIDEISTAARSGPLG